MERYCVCLRNGIEATFSARKNAKEYLSNLERCYKSDTDKITKESIEKTTLGQEDFVTVSGTPYRMLPPKNNKKA